MMISTRLATLLGTDTSVVPDVKPKTIAGLMSQISDLLGNAMWIGIICGVLGLIIAGGMITGSSELSVGDRVLVGGCG